MEELLRPPPPRSVAERVRAWIDWFGYGRIVGSAIAMVIVCAGAFWLVRVPPPPTEASLPLASTTSSIHPSAAAPDGTAVPATGTVPPGELPVLVVHVAGAVVAPGVYELAAGSRTDDAIAAAGGPGPDANPNALNLAAPLTDGSRIYVPQVGEELPVPVATAGAPTGAGSLDAAIVNVNAATAAELEALPGVGPATALAIVSERDGNGPFLSVDDLDRVPGIGPAKIEALRELVTT